MISLQPLHSFGFNTHARQLETVTQVTQLESLRTIPKEHLYVLGGGSNTVFVEDNEFTVIQMANRSLSIIQQANEFRVIAGAGMDWHELVITLHQQGIYGLENLALIPGTVGAAPIQNIGAYGLEVGELIERVYCFHLGTGRYLEFSQADCEFGYRDSVFKSQLTSDYIIHQVQFLLPKGAQVRNQYHGLDDLTTPTASEVLDRVISLRRSKLPDPKILGNAGSFFKNPIIEQQHFARLRERYASMPGYEVFGPNGEIVQIKVPAAWLIDQLGFKSKRCGGIGCHQHQPLVLVNNGEGTGEQLLAFARQIRDAVFEAFEIELENEVRLVGQHGLVVL